MPLRSFHSSSSTREQGAFRGAFLLAMVALLFAPVGAKAVDAQIHLVPPGTRVEDLPKLLPAKSEPVDEVADAGDFYVGAGGRRVGLLRARNSVAVRFTPQVAAQKGLAALKARAGVPLHDEVARAQFRRNGALHLLRARKKGVRLDAAGIGADPNVAYAYPVFVDAKTRSRMMPTDEILARFAAGVTVAGAQTVANSAGLDLVASTGEAALNVFRFRIRKPKGADPLQVSRTLAGAAGVVWAQPNFVREIHHAVTPPNTLFKDQQSLQNTGHDHAIAGADVEAVQAWETTTGNSSIVIAIIDDGVDLSHPGLRIFTNPGETGDGKETDAIDSDGNGKIDDVHGWDFADDDNDPSPVGFNGHGTGCAGIAGAKFGSQARTAGIAAGCTILPVKIADDSGIFTTDEKIGDAILYAAHFADVLSNSWGGGSQSPFIDDAITYASTMGRGGKGCPVFFATGNYASSWYDGGGRYRLSTASLSGNYYYSFFYEKGPTSGGADGLKIDNVCLLGADGYTHLNNILSDEDFEWFVFGWWLANGGGATANWSLKTEDTLTGTGGYLSAVSPTLEEGQYAWLITPLLAITGVETFAFAGAVSMPDDSYFYVAVYDENGLFVGAYGPWNGVPDPPIAETTYPANAPGAIAVGAATDADLRSDYSEYAGKLDFVAPSNGGWNDIATLDPVGSIGWTDEDFKMNFGGTSAATPLAAGIAALALSVAPSLTAAEIRTLLRSTCDKIGGVTYGADGTHPEYGFGRVNARKAVASALPAISVSDVSILESGLGTMLPATFTLTLSAPAVREVGVQFRISQGMVLTDTNNAVKTGAIHFPIGTTTKTFTVWIDGANVVRTRDVALLLSEPVNATLARTKALATVTAADSDGDGLSDFWEASHGLDASNPADAALDSDGDGFSNLDEFNAGTDPHDPASRFAVTVSVMNEDDFRLTFRGMAGLIYVVEYKDQLTDPLWLPLGDEVTGTGGEMEIVDAGALTSHESRVYRVRVAGVP